MTWHGSTAHYLLLFHPSKIKWTTHTTRRGARRPFDWRPPFIFLWRTPPPIGARDLQRRGGISCWSVAACRGEEGSEKTLSSYLTILHVQSGQLCVCGGRRVVVYVMANRRLHSKRKKRKALATHHLFFYQSNNLQKEGSPHFWQLSLCELVIKIFQLQVQRS